jgi:hypothetical protein
LFAARQGRHRRIRGWAKRVNSPRLVIIDVFAKVRPATHKGENPYEADYRALGPLKKLTYETGVAVIIVHHTRKAEAEDAFDAVSGSTGLTGAADATLVLSRDSNGTTLYGRGRDLDEFEVALSFDKTTGQWALLGAAAEVRRSDERAIILRVLRDAGEPMTPTEIAPEARMRAINVRQLLGSMVRAGEVKKVRDRRGRHPRFSWPLCSFGKGRHADKELPINAADPGCIERGDLICVREVHEGPDLRSPIGSEGSSRHGAGRDRAGSIHRRF